MNLTWTDFLTVAVVALVLIGALSLTSGGNPNTTPCDQGSVNALFSSCPRK